MSNRLGGDLDLLLDTVDQFAGKAEHRLFAEESPDGDLDAIAALLLDAAEIGLLADVDEDVGRWGVWGAHVDDEGPTLSLAVLRRLGRVCAGLAAAVHAQGLGVLLLRCTGLEHSLPPGTRVAAGFCPPYGLALDPRTAQERIHLVDDRLDGKARFVLSAGPADAVALAVHAPGAHGGADEAVVALPAETPGLRVVPSGRRVGLRAVTMFDVAADGVRITQERQVRGSSAADRLRTTVAADWLGQAAIALGCAEQAVSVARTYTENRVQGGVTISEHAAIRLLLSRAEHDAAVVASILDRHAETALAQLDANTLLRWAIDARIAVGEHASRAATNALQALGGYGYMDEYGLSKRLRDLTALRVLHGGPDQLLLARNDVGAAS
jgi:alkylation response protein AidB-like acyl-CoA dehydrogenase